MGNIDVKIEKWDAAKDKVKPVNKLLFDLVEPIAASLKFQQQDYVYSMGFKYGETIIENGQMVAMKDPSKIRLNAENFSGTTAPDLNQFIEDCGEDTDHPLALVTKNYIEIYCEHKSSSKINYSFPLNLIKQGELFGVWGSVNSIFEDYKKNYYGWSGVAGKICILPLFPVPEERKSSQLYRNSFPQIFPNSNGNPIDGIINSVNELFGTDDFAEIIIIPEVYYKSNKKDKPELQNAKHKLRELLCQIAWDQTKVVREMAWDDKELMSELMSALKIKESDLAFHLAKHIINITNGNSFLLKPVSINDEILFEVFEHLVKKFKSHSDGTGNLLNYTTPVFLHYTKLTKDNPKGIELTHFPSINIYLPETRPDKMRDSVMQKIFYDGRMQNFLQKKGHDATLKYFKEKPNYSVKTDKNSSYVIDLKEYIGNDLNNLYSSLLGGDKKIELRQFPGLFNSFIHIEKVNW